MGGSRMGHDQMESNSLQKVMACVAVKDIDSSGWLDKGVVQLTVVHNHFRIDLDVSDHIACTEVGTAFEETGPKQVEEPVVRKRRSRGGSQIGLDQMESDGL